MPGNVDLEGTPCIGRARDRNGGRVGRSGTREDMSRTTSRKVKSRWEEIGKQPRRWKGARGEDVDAS